MEAVIVIFRLCDYTKDMPEGQKVGVQMDLWYKTFERPWIMDLDFYLWRYIDYKLIGLERYIEGIK